MRVQPPGRYSLWNIAAGVSSCPKGFVRENSKSSQLISSSLDGISQSKKRIVSALAELEELPEQAQQHASHLEKIRGAAVTLCQVHELLERHVHEQARTG